MPPRDKDGEAVSPLALSTLRGQFADNREWSADPARPAVIVGTVDMIGSRLLFSGYGVGFKGQPLHAGFLGQDVLLVHDEAHLEPAFQELLVGIEKEQKRCKEFREFRVIELSATSRGNEMSLVLTDAEKTPPETLPAPATEPIHFVWQRQRAKKAIHLHENQEEKKLADDVANRALNFKDSKQAILLYLRKVEDVEKVVAKLRAARQPTQQLTGTLRGLERDQLVEDAIFRRFLPGASSVARRSASGVSARSVGQRSVNATPISGRLQKPARCPLCSTYPPESARPQPRSSVGCTAGAKGTT